MAATWPRLNGRPSLLLNSRAQASETSVSHQRGPPRSGLPNDRRNYHTKPIASFTANALDPSPNCLLCKTDKHPLYACVKFKSLPHEKRLSTLKDNHLCMNCLKPGHFVHECKSLHRCRKCQRPHHTLLHLDQGDAQGGTSLPTPPSSHPISPITANHATRAYARTHY